MTTESPSSRSSRLSATLSALTPSAPYINTRRGIAWGSTTAPFSEPSNVLILHGTKLAADVRIDKESGKIDWAMVVWAEEIEKSPQLIRFHHIIDSRDITDPDEGYMHPMANGSVLETGRMGNPETGRVEYYEELWHDLAPITPSGHSGFTLVLRDTLWRKFIFVHGGYALVVEDQAETDVDELGGAAESLVGGTGKVERDFAVLMCELELDSTQRGGGVRWKEKYRVGQGAKCNAQALGTPPTAVPTEWKVGFTVDVGSWKGWVVEDLLRAGE